MVARHQGAVVNIKLKIMPLVERVSVASPATATVSTAPVWTGSGAAKQPDAGWWARVQHNVQGARPAGSLAQSALWSAWLLSVCLFLFVCLPIFLTALS